MSFWGNRLVGQLEGFIRRRKSGLEIWRLPNEYGSETTIMLRIRILGNTYLDVAEWNYRWNASIVVETKFGIEPELQDRDMLYLGDFPQTITRDIAELVIPMLEKFKKAAKEYDPFSDD